jgi:glyoxylase-like metal-dependent hydrolase (beta-lactamase superfamily II)
LFIGGIYEGEKGLKAGYTLRAVAMREGRTNSDIATFQYVVDRRDHHAYVSEEILPGVRMARDSDNDKMFLVRGSKKFALIDCGMGRGELKAYLSQYTEGLPLVVIFTHNHFDHIGQADQFIRDSQELIGEADRPEAVRVLKNRGIPDEVIEKNLGTAHDGDRVDLGDRSLAIYAAPGHTPGSLVVFDEQNGNLFTGDSFGSNSPTIPDALWLQWSQTPLDIYLATVKNTRANFRGKVKYMMTGHNDHPLEGEAYLDNLQNSLQSLMDKGDAVLVPSYRPVGFLQVTIGDRMHDPNWVAININKDHYLPAPIEQISGLTRLSVEGAQLTPRFTPEVKEYTVKLPARTRSITITAEPTSTRASGLTLNGEKVTAGEAHEVKLGKAASPVKIDVTAADGTHSTEYVVTVNRQ